MAALRNRSSIPALARAMRAFFEDYDLETQVHVGLPARFEYGHGDRVVIIPGEYDGSETLRPIKGGSLGPPEKHADLYDTVNGYRQRTLVTWDKTLTLSLWGADPTNLQSEEAQLEATESLFELAVQAIDLGVDPETHQFVGLANVVWGTPTWVKPPSIGGYGQEILVTLTHTGVLYAPPVNTTTAAPNLAKPTIGTTPPALSSVSASGSDPIVVVGTNMLDGGANTLVTFAFGSAESVPSPCTFSQSENLGVRRHRGGDGHQGPLCHLPESSARHGEHSSSVGERAFVGYLGDELSRIFLR